MTLQQLIDTANYVDNVAADGIAAFKNLKELASQLKARLDPEVLINLMPISQTTVDEIVAIYTPLYLASLPPIEAAADAVGTDSFS